MNRMRECVAALALVPALAVFAVEKNDCPHWISVMPLPDDRVEAVAADSVDLGERTIVDGIACTCVVHPEGDPVADKAAIYAKRFAALAPLVRKGSSVRLGVLMQATMGHGGEPGQRTPWQLAVHADGKITYRFCPLDRNFLAYIAQASRTLSAAKPDFFMVDDDTRLIWGLPGCFCPLHLAEFAKRTGRAWTREEVVERLKAGDAEVTAKWLALKRESLAAFFRTIRENYDPSIPGILCVVRDREHLVNSREFARILAAPGQIPVVRGNGAPYHGHDSESIVGQRTLYSAQRALVGDDIVFLQESDTCPHTRWATCATRLVNHMVMLALEDVKGAKIWITRSEPSENRSRAAYRRAFRDNRALMEWAAKADFRQRGFVIPRLTFADGNDWGSRYFARTGIPYRYGTPGRGEVVALSGGVVDRLSDAELKELLAGLVLLDGTAAIRLAARGFTADIGVEAKPWSGKTIQRHLFADGRANNHPLIAGSADLSRLAEGAEIRSRLYNRPSLGADFDYVAPGGVLFANARGGRVFTFAQALTDFRPSYFAAAMYSETYRDEVVKAAGELCGTIPGGVYYLGDVPMMLEVGSTEEDGDVFVLDNLEVDVDDAPELAFAEPPVTIERLQPNGSWKEVPFVRGEGGVCTLDTVILSQVPAVFRFRRDEYATPESQGVSSRAILRWLDACESGVEDMHGFVLRRHGKVIAEGSWRPYDTLNETHMLYSHSKSFTSTAIGFLVDDGKLDLDESVVSIFPDKAPENPSENLRLLRVRDLLTMNVGAEYTDAERKDCGGDWVRFFLHNEIQHRPGTVFRYDSCATHVLAAIVERRSGRRLMDFLDERLFSPLGIVKAWSGTSPDGTACGGWGMNMTTRELSRFGQFCMNGGTWNGRRLLSQEWLDMARARQTWSGSIRVAAETLGSGSDWNQGYGFQFWRCRHGAWRCDGAYGQYTIGMPKEDATISIHAGVDGMQKEIDVVWETLLPALGGKDPLPEDPAAVGELRKRCRNLAIRPVAGRREGAEKALGRDYLVKGENDHHIAAVRVDRSPEGWVCALTTQSGVQRIPVGYGAWAEGKASFDTVRYEGLMRLIGEQTTRSSGAVRDDGSFFCRIRLTDTPGHIDLTLAPDGSLSGKVRHVGTFDFAGAAK